MEARLEHDPSKASRRLPADQAAWMRRLGRDSRRPLALAMAAPLAAGALLVAQAFLLARVLHLAIVEGVSRDALLPQILAIAGLILGRALLSRIGDEAGAVAAERIKRALRESLFAALLARSPEWIRSRASGVLASAVVDQVEAFEGFFARYLPSMIAAAVLPIAFAALVLPVEPLVGTLFLVSAPLIPVFMALVGWGAEAASRRQIQAFARLSGFFADRLRGLTTLKLHGRAEAEAERVREASEELRRRTLGVLRIAFLSSTVLEFFATLGIAGVSIYVGLSYLGYIDLRSTPLTLETGLFCLMMAPEVYLPLRQFAAHYHDRAAARAAVAEIAQAFDALPELPGSRSSAPATPAVAEDSGATGAIAVAVDGLVLRTPDGGRVVLDGAVFSVMAGESLALVGESGIGKTTLIEALCGLRAHEGTILLDGREIRTIGRPELSRRVAYLGQRPHLFHGTVADNIRLARASASDEEVLEAAARAGLLDCIARLPSGLATPIGEHGYGLSGGEAHRVALARIFLRSPDLLLLDEPTAHLDAATERKVLDAILDFARGRTLIVATHSETTAGRMGRILRVAGRQVLPTPHPHLGGTGRSASQGVA